MSRLKIDHLNEFVSVFRHRWDPIVLILVAERPRRRKELTREVVDGTGEQIAEGVLSEVLNRLQDDGMIVRESPAPQHVVYHPTAAAMRWVAWLRRVNGLAPGGLPPGAWRPLGGWIDDGSSEPPASIDTTKPSSARVWNYLLGGNDHFEIDRIVGDEIRSSFPPIVMVAQEQRKFLVRVVTYLATEAGIRQFLDIGTGLPTANNTHQVAQALAPESRIVYVDNDPMVLAYARALLTSTPEGATAYVDSDVEKPDRILEAAAHTLDFSKPIALTMLGILGNVADYAEARSIVRRLVDAVPSGSFLVISDGADTIPENVEAVRRANQSGHPYHLRSPGEIAAFFEGLDLVEPAVVPSSHWRPAPGPLPPASAAYGGVAIKR